VQNPSSEKQKYQVSKGYVDQFGFNLNRSLPEFVILTFVKLKILAIAGEE